MRDKGGSFYLLSHHGLTLMRVKPTERAMGDLMFLLGILLEVRIRP